MEDVQHGSAYGSQAENLRVGKRHPRALVIGLVLFAIWHLCSIAVTVFADWTQVDLSFAALLPAIVATLLLGDRLATRARCMMPRGRRLLAALWQLLFTIPVASFVAYFDSLTRTSGEIRLSGDLITILSVAFVILGALQVAGVYFLLWAGEKAGSTRFSTGRLS